MTASKEARFAGSGVALIVGAGILLATRPSSSIGAFSLAFGLGMCASIRPVARSSRAHIAALAAIGVGFVAYRFGVLVADGLTATRVVVLAMEAIALGCAFGLAYEHAHGVARIAALFQNEHLGYAPVLDERAAARAVEAELARSRRHGRPLTFLLLEPSAQGPAPDFEATMSRVSRAAQSELRRAYARERACGLIAEQVRRSDVIVCEEHRFLVMSSDTSAEGTEMLAARMVGTAHARLGLQFRTGVASFPTHGTTYEELVEVAKASAGTTGRHNGNGNGNRARSGVLAPAAAHSAPEPVAPTIPADVAPPPAAVPPAQAAP
jgi:hypothetical protein